MAGLCPLCFGGIVLQLEKYGGIPVVGRREKNRLVSEPQFLELLVDSHLSAALDCWASVRN